MKSAESILEARASRLRSAPSERRLAARSPQTSLARRSKLAVLGGCLVCLFAAASQCQAQSTCQDLANEIKKLSAELKDLRAARNGLAADLQKAGSGKPAIASQIKQLIPQIAAKKRGL